LNRKERNPLLQDLTIGLISAKVVQIDENGKEISFPLIDPFQYTAKIKRFSGDRFSGLMTGLEVTGQETQDDISSSSETPTSLASFFSEIEIYSNNDEIEATLYESVQNSCVYQIGAASHVSKEGEMRVHCGEIQSTAIFSVLGMFSSNSNQGVERSNDKRQQFLKSAVKRGGLGEISTISPTNFVHSTRDLNKSSIFHLPFPYIQLFLPNDSFVTARRGVLKMRTDGSRSIFEADGGVTVNGHMLLQVGSPINVDMVRKVITLKPKKNAIAES
jgi:hypothetical protein